MELLAPLDEANYQELVTAMKTIEKILYQSYQMSWKVVSKIFIIYY
ncbi:hypothetical protein ABW365_03125 [Enterococcus avium]